MPTKAAHDRRLAHLEDLCRELEVLQRETRDLFDALNEEIARAHEEHQLFTEPTRPAPLRRRAVAGRRKSRKSKARMR